MVSASLALHHGLVRLHGDRVQLRLEPGLGSTMSSLLWFSLNNSEPINEQCEYCTYSPGTGGEAGSGEEALLNQAVVLLSCASYRNQCLHVFIRPALLALAMGAASSNQKRELKLWSMTQRFLPFMIWS